MWHIDLSKHGRAFGIREGDEGQTDQERRENSVGRIKKFQLLVPHWVMALTEGYTAGFRPAKKHDKKSNYHLCGDGFDPLPDNEPAPSLYAERYR